MRFKLRRFSKMVSALVVILLLSYGLYVYWPKGVRLTVDLGLTVDALPEKNLLQQPPKSVVQTKNELPSISQPSYLASVTTRPTQHSKISTAVTTDIQHTSEVSTAESTELQQPSKVSPATNTSLQHIHHCKDSICSEYLPEDGAKKYWLGCTGRKALSQPPQIKCSCRFQNGTGRKLVALVSLPGCGNTWVRALLEKATGICTGGIYCDGTLASGGFCGEAYRSRAALAIKTHELELLWNGINSTVGRYSQAFFDSAILVIRDPHTGAIAEYNRRHGRTPSLSSRGHGNSHVNFINDPSMYGSNPKWDEYVPLYLVNWIKIIRSTVIGGMKKLGRPVLVMYYEDLKKNEASEVKKMVDFLEVPYVMEKDRKEHQSFYRNHTDSFEHFTAEQKDHYNREITKFSEELQKHQLFDVSKKMLEYVYNTPV